MFDTSRIERGPTFAGVDTSGQVLEPDSQPFKSKRFMPIFSDLRYLAHNEPVKRMIASSPTSESMIREFSKTCQLFTGVNPNRRMHKEHVEFESDSWISVFNVSLSLARVVRVYGDAWSLPANRGNVRELVRAIELVVMDILELIVKSTGAGRLDPMVFHWVQFAEGASDGSEAESWKVVKFEVGGDTGLGVSFHHRLAC
jgi:E3 ubiquitin-protein ligase UBR1